MRSTAARIRAAFGRTVTAGQSLLSRTIGESVDERMRWRGAHRPGPYLKSDVVRDGEWTMVALADTEAPAAPSPIGSREWVTDLYGGVTWGEHIESTTSLAVGALYTMAGFRVVSGVRYHVPSGAIGMLARLAFVDDPLGDAPDVNILFSGLIIGNAVDQWVAVPQGLNYVRPGHSFGVLLLINSIDSEQTFAYPWDYKRKNGYPDEGEAWHQSGNNQDTLIFHQQDKDSVDRTAQLALVQPGSTIEMASSGMTWNVRDVEYIAPTYTFTVDPAQRSGEATSIFRFNFYAATPIPYVRDDDLYSGSSTVRGLFSATGTDDLVEGDHGYGVDIEIQEMSLSSDWDIVAHSS